ncbi:hypothetical protein IPV09_00780 [Tessaracoccus sp. SD287]|uniref:hypothetical protein n=1 Tax=Tessaracoccus sp. SD287 TaxID=2782008 RepID=UPI001A96C5BF|nr:hypothetical protein [Tessaracoccus sp. SD287]MBO1029869.1 hypothetical protein [Tessaracoccus sp. SD287]
MSRRRGLDGVDFDEANHEGGDFADFVADTSEQSSRLAYALTGDTELSARVETQAYADVGRRWTDLDAAEARRMLREQLWHHARRADPDPEALTAVADSGWRRRWGSPWTRLTSRRRAVEPAGHCSPLAWGWVPPLPSAWPAGSW